MAKRKKGVSAGYKASNYDLNTKVGSNAVDALKAGGTFEKNVELFKTGNLSSIEGSREAMNRFYGVDRVNQALGGASRPTPSAGASTVREGYSSVPSKPTVQRSSYLSAPVQRSSYLSGGKSVGNTPPKPSSSSWDTNKPLWTNTANKFPIIPRALTSAKASIQRSLSSPPKPPGQ